VLDRSISTPWGRLPVLLPILFGSGLCIAPGLIMVANLIDQHGPRDRLSEAQSWLNTSFSSGGALGSALAGLLVDAGGPGRAFVGASGAVVVSTLLALWAAWLWRTPLTRR
jgi:predicted MFS family arabinose efflux permease